VTGVLPTRRALLPASGAPRPDAVQRAHELLRDARAQERSGCVTEAMECYTAAIEMAERGGERAVHAEALRRLGVLHHHRGESPAARASCRRSHEVAVASGDDVLAAEALNVLAGFDFEDGAIEVARQGYHGALLLGGSSANLRARIEQNLGILATIQGRHDEAMGHYRRSLDAHEIAGDEDGKAIAYHNLGMISADRRLWDDADRYYRQSRAIAEVRGDVHLQGLCLLNHAEVHLARQHYDEARHDAEAALVIFDQLGARRDKPDAYRVIGMVYRETGRVALAESRLRAAIELAVGTASLLSEAEAARELALLYQTTGRNQEALTFLHTAHRLFHRLDATADLVDVGGKVAGLEETYLTVVRDWGQSIESSDSYTFGHCERVAGYALAVARGLGLDETEQTTVRVGAYLHDVGKVRVPHEILNKPGRLTNEEFEVIKMHPVWGVELLATVEFPWDIKPIIRWHHEKYDGTGYPDRLRGDEIPLAAQVIGIVDVYDALTTTRSYRPAMSRERALAQMEEERRQWRPDVYTAFLKSLGKAEAARTAA
jgi:putative nucleotidyltransferase with HDIG domain